MKNILLFSISYKIQKENYEFYVKTTLFVTFFYIRGIEDLELWLSEIEGQLQSEDFGKDLTSVQNLLKKHALVEADVNSHQDRIDGVKIAAEQFCSAGHFDAENIKAKHAALADRYTALMKPMSARKQVLYII